MTNKAETTVSSLIIQKARVEDGGSYSCKTNNVEPASIKVHVLTGKSELEFFKWAKLDFFLFINIIFA